MNTLTADVSRRTYVRLAFAASFSSFCLIAGLAFVGSFSAGSSLACKLMCGVALLAGMVALASGWKESNLRYQTLFYLLAVWLLWTGIQEPVQAGLLRWVFVHPKRAFYAVEFNHMMWALTALLVGAYVLVDAVLRPWRIGAKWFVALLLALSFWGLLWHEYLLNPEHLYRQPLVQDFVAVDRAVRQRALDGGGFPGAAEISRQLTLPRWEGTERVGKLQAEESAARIGELLEYLDGPEDYVLLVIRPLNALDGLVALACIMLIGLGLGLRAWRDPPESAHIEKVLMLLLLTWVYESLHAFFFSLVRDSDVYATVSDIGFVISAALYFMLAYMFSRRLDFITSIEGRYYERVLEHDASSVTRWVDRFDLYVIKKFLGRRAPLRRLFTVKNNRYA